MILVGKRILTVMTDSMEVLVLDAETLAWLPSYHLDRDRWRQGTKMSGTKVSRLVSVGDDRHVIIHCRRNHHPPLIWDTLSPPSGTNPFQIKDPFAKHLSIHLILVI